jgi:NAD(P)-dependent dehydrogenase (short-subunit alcohol dehydrogenase family)
MRLENKIALITGAGSGIGRATALRFAEEGAVVGVADVSLESAETVAAEVREAGGIAEPIAVDVSSREQAAAAVGRMVSEFGRLDILINNAGINRDAFVHKMTDDQWDAVIDVNLKGAFSWRRRRWR